MPWKWKANVVASTAQNIKKWKDDRKAAPLYKIDSRNGNVQLRKQLLTAVYPSDTHTHTHNSVISTIKASNRLTNIDLRSNIRTQCQPQNSSSLIWSQPSLHFGCECVAANRPNVVEGWNNKRKGILCTAISLNTGIFLSFLIFPGKILVILI